MRYAFINCVDNIFGKNDIISCCSSTRLILNVTVMLMTHIIVQEVKYRRPIDLGRFIMLKMISPGASAVIYGFYRTLIRDNRIITVGCTTNPEAASVEYRAVIAAGNGASFCHHHSL